MPQNPLVEDGDLLVHPGSQIDDHPKFAQPLDQFGHLVGGRAAELAWWPGKDANANAASKRCAQQIDPSRCAWARGKGRKDDDGSLNTGEVRLEGRVKRAFRECAGGMFRKVEGSRHDAVQTIHPITLRKWEQLLQVKGLAIFNEVID